MFGKRDQTLIIAKNRIKWNLNLFFLLLFIFLGCSYDTSNEFQQQSEKTIAENYLNKLIYLDSLSQDSRNITQESIVYPSILYEIDVEDENGNQFHFEELSTEDKEKFYDDWKKSYLKEIENKLLCDESLRNAVLLENTAFENTVSSKKAQRAIADNDVMLFIKIYSSNLSKLIKKTKNERAALVDISGAQLDQNSLEIVKKYYKQGSFFVCTDSSSSSSSAYIGHSSIMHEEKWNPEWDNDAMAMITITSTPIGNSASWKGKTDGVQYEPLAYWIGNKSGCAENVSIYDVQKVTWIWCVLFNYYKYTEPSLSDVSAAIKKADDARIAQLPYNWSFIKWTTSSMYCSQLVWSSWYNVSSKYDLSQGPHTAIVSPTDLTMSKSSKYIVSYKNIRE